MKRLTKQNVKVNFIDEGPDRFGAAKRRTCDERVVIAVFRRKRLTRFDADWWRTNLELSPAARDEIFAEHHRILQEGFRAGGGGVLNSGGGRACLDLEVHADRAQAMRSVLERVLSRPGAFVRHDTRVRS